MMGMSKPLLDLKRDAAGRFVVGTESPRKQIGARNKLSQRFLHDMHQWWVEEGPETIRRAAIQSPSALIRSLAILLRPSTRDMPVEEHSDYEAYQSPADVLEAVRSEFGPEVARALAKEFGDAM